MCECDAAVGEAVGEGAAAAAAHRDLDAQSMNERSECGDAAWQ
jgi:hypothetical protein